MAEAAEKLLAGTGWLPPLLRTGPSTWADDPQEETEAVADMQEAPDPDADAPAAPETAPLSPDLDADDGGEAVDGHAFNVAAE